MIKTTAMMLEELRDYASPKTKLSRMVRNDECFRIVKGLYETERNVEAYLLAGSIYGPSYISFEFALSWHGLIPEAVYTITCATYEKKKKKKYDTPYGMFSYRDVPAAAFPLSIELRNQGEYWFRIACPEKALCDELYAIRPVRNAREFKELLFEDLRIDETVLRTLNKDTIEHLSERYHSTNVRKLCNLMRKG